MHRKTPQCTRQRRLNLDRVQFEKMKGVSRRNSFMLLAHCKSLGREWSKQKIASHPLTRQHTASQRFQMPACAVPCRQLHVVGSGNPLISSALIAGRASQTKEQKWRTQFGQLKVKMLNPEIEVPQAQELLHDCYIKELGWTFSEENPSGFRIEKQGGRTMLKDDLEHHCSWFGSTFQGQVIACARVVHRDENGNIDISRYADSEKPLTKHLLSMQVNPRLHEFQRTAINPLFRKSGVLCEIFKMVAQFILEEESSLVGVTANKSILKFIDGVGGIIIDDHFDYGEGKPAKMIYWPNGLLDTIISRMQPKDSKMGKRSFSA